MAQFGVNISDKQIENLLNAKYDLTMGYHDLQIQVNHIVSHVKLMLGETSLVHRSFQTWPEHLENTGQLMKKYSKRTVALG